MRPAKLAMFLSLSFSLFSSVVVCQDRARSVEGSVTYRGGEITPEATVQIEDVESKQVISFVTGRDGRYHFRTLKMDKNYTLVATKNGHWSDVRHLSKFSGKTAEVVNLRLKDDPDAH